MSRSLSMKVYVIVHDSLLTSLMSRKECTTQNDGPGFCIYTNSQGNEAQCMCDSLAAVSLPELGSEEVTMLLKSCL